MHLKIKDCMKFALIMLLGWLTLAFGEEKVDLTGWNKVYSKDGLDFYSKKIENSKLLAFKAVGVLDVNMGEMMAALRTVNTQMKWDKNTVKKETVEDISDIEAITYSESRIPWPFNNRDMVLHNKLFLDKEEKIFYVHTHSVEDQRYPKRKGLVRAQINFSRFRTKPLSLDKTFVDFEVHVDPKGNIPAWIVNIVQKSFPYDFLTGLANFCRKTKLKPNAGVQAMIDDYFKLTGHKLW